MRQNTMIAAAVLAAVLAVCTGCGSDESSAGTASSAAETTTSTAETTTSAAETTTSAAETTTSAAETTTSAAETTTSAAETTTSVAESSTDAVWFEKGVYAGLIDGKLDVYYVFLSETSGRTFDTEVGIGVGFECEQKETQVMFHMASADDNTLMKMSGSSSEPVGTLTAPDGTETVLTFRKLADADPADFDGASYQYQE